MSNTTTMQATFETQKNRKAFVYTTIICGAILLIALLVSWKNGPHAPKVAEELIEINLGNDIEGFGEVQPLTKGEKSPSTETAAQQQSAEANNTKTEEIKTEENTDPESAPITRPIKTTPKVATPAVVITPAPKPQKPKIAGYNGPKGGTGNGATEDNGYKYQGNKPGGTGDAGSPNGKPDSYGNTPGGKSGVNVIRGVRPVNLGSLKLEDDFNENAKVYIDVRYSNSGDFTSVTVVKGTTTTSSTILSIARRKVTLLKFPPSENGGVSTILLNFKVHD